MLHLDVQIILDSEVISVAPGEAHAVPLLVVNRSAEEQTIGLQVDGIPADWATLDLHRFHLDSGGQQQVNLLIQPPAAPEGLAGRYRLRIQAAAQGVPEAFASAEADLLVAAVQVGEQIAILLPGTHYTVEPGGQVSLPITLVNKGPQADVFRLHVDGLPAGWVSIPAALAQLEAGQHLATALVIQPPRLPGSSAGRHPFTIRVQSRAEPARLAEAGCILTIAAYSQTECELQPRQVQSGQVARVVLRNQGNIPETFRVSFESRSAPLVFEAAVGERPEPGGGEAGLSAPPQARLIFSEVQTPLVLQVPPGTDGEIIFRLRPASLPLFGEEVYYPFSAVVETQPDMRQSLEGEVQGRAWIPRWVVPALLLAMVACMCMFSFALNSRRSGAAGQTQTAESLFLQISAATQTAAFNQTQAVAVGQADADGDGLVNERELALGTDPTRADSDTDELLDGPEVDSHATDPLNPDTDGDGLSDGEEVLRRGSDPRSPDTDLDGLGDGDEVQRGTNPLQPDSDADGLSDGVEVQAGSDPLNPDTDSDRLPDGRETGSCPAILNPDSDGDGIIDGQDLDPCDPANPALTATAASGLPTATSAPPTALPSVTPTAPPTSPPTPALPSATPPAGTIPGRILMESSRDGNPEIYIFQPADGSLLRLTNHPALDALPSWSPDGSRIAFASDRDGNVEIYTVAADGSDLVRLTDNPAEDTDPAWSPDGSQIAFTTNRDGNREIYIMNADGSSPANLTRSPGDDSQPYWYVQSTALVLETEWILFTSNRDGNQEVYSMLPDGGEQFNISNHPADDSAPVAVHNGAQIAFVSVRDGNPEVYIMDSNGALPQNLTLHPAADLAPCPTSDLAWLAFATDRDGNWEIYALRLEDGALLNLTTNPAADQNPAWLLP